MKPARRTKTISRDAYEELKDLFAAATGALRCAELLTDEMCALVHEREANGHMFDAVWNGTTDVDGALKKLGVKVGR